MDRAREIVESHEGGVTLGPEAYEEMATGRWELAGAVWQETDLLLWKPPAAPRFRDRLFIQVRPSFVLNRQVRTEGPML
ncbi:hypothetical protein [Streptomyces sp. NPDC093097]|uniref:hypothetical protein n=1 Tax=Streptomyces sp. NPDC093097 TaxID=3366027 RepID=UPI0038076433